MTLPDRRTVVWICQPDDFEPSHVAGIMERLERLYGAAAARAGFGFRFVAACDVVAASCGRPRLWHLGADLLTARNCFIVHDTSRNPQAARHLVGIYRTIDASGSVLLNRSISGPDYLENDKLAMLHRAARIGVPTPHTVAVPYGRYAGLVVPRLIVDLGTGPYIVKPRELGMGTGVLKVDTAEQLRAAIDITAQSGQVYLVQRFLPNDGDLRIYIIDGRIVAAQLRRPQPGNYLANISQGGMGVADTAGGEVADLSLRIADHLGATYLCVDWLVTPDGPVFVEWGTALCGFSGLPEPYRDRVADAFFAWVAGHVERAEAVPGRC